MLFRKYLLSNVYRSPDDALGGSDTGPVEVVSVANTPDNHSMSAREAAQALASFRYKPKEAAAETPAAPAVEREAAPVEAVTESADEAGAAPQEIEATGETQATDPPDEAPLDLPRSWTKDRAEHWAKLDRGTQEFLLDHDRKASAEVRRVQNEAAEKLKGLTAKEQAVEQARTQYETALPALLDTIQQQMNGEFSDIKTIEDVQNLAKTDWPRYVMWDAAQKRIAAVNQQVETAKQRQTQEKQAKLSEFIKIEGEKLSEKIPEMADPEKARALEAKAVKFLTSDIGITPDELGQFAREDKHFSVHDHRFQELVHDAMRYREAKSSAAKPAPKPLPPVQRPGVSQPKGAAAVAKIEQIGRTLDRANNSNAAVRAAADLLRERRAAARQ